MSQENAKKFLDALENDKNLRAAVDLEHSLLKIAKVWDPNLDFTSEDLEKVIEAKWGPACITCISAFCFSEVPGF